MKRRLCVAGLVAAVLTVTACGGGGGSPAAEEETRSITVADTEGIPSLFLTYGVREGYFKKAGLDVEVIAQTGGSASVPSLVSGDVEVVGSNVVSLLVAAGQGLPLSVIAAGTSAAESPQEDFSGLVVPADSDIASPADLAGARIGVNSLENINEVVIANVLEKEGISLKQVDLVELPFPDMQAALERGDVDASFLIEPFLTTALSDGMTAITRPYTALRPGLQAGAYVVTEETAASDPELVEAFQEGVQATADAIREDPEAFRKAMPELGEFDPEIAAKLSLPVWEGTNDKESIAILNERSAKYGLIEDEVDLNELLYQGGS
jgi:ABC-type nitrate/sulfonate/bicarbonate transport system substrate-binding protein